MRRHPDARRSSVWDWVIIVGGLYLFTCIMRYRLSNPELTETQLFLRLPQAVMWR